MEKKYWQYYSHVYIYWDTVIWICCDDKIGFNVRTAETKIILEDLFKWLRNMRWQWNVIFFFKFFLKSWINIDTAHNYTQVHTKQWGRKLSRLRLPSCYHQDQNSFLTSAHTGSREIFKIICSFSVWLVWWKPIWKLHSFNCVGSPSVRFCFYRREERAA